MSTTAALSSMAAAQSAAAAAEASRARDLACKAVIASYDAKNANVTEMKTYAECVQRTYPDSDNVPVPVLKAGVAALLIATVVGLVYGWNEDGPAYGFVMAVAFPCLLAVAGLFLMLAVAGVQFVVGA